MVEYGSTPYMMFMLGEYVAIGTMCAMATILFLGGWLPPFDFAPFTWVPGVIWFVLKAMFMFFLFAMAKAIVPRDRYRPTQLTPAGRCSCRSRSPWWRSWRPSSSSPISRRRDKP